MSLISSAGFLQLGLDKQAIEASTNNILCDIEDRVDALSYSTIKEGVYYRALQGPCGTMCFVQDLGVNGGFDDFAATQFVMGGFDNDNHDVYLL